MKHVVCEIFFSLQGEGVRAGKPSIFVRYAGCNLRCQFGLKCKNCGLQRDIPENIQEVINNIDSYKNVQDLPVFPNYCDTYIGILPEFARFWKTYESTEELGEAIFDLIKDNPNYSDLSNVDIVFTGGEPMLHQPEMLDLVKYLRREHNAYHVTIETNGTIPVRDDLSNEWMNVMSWQKLMFSVSPKISSANYTFEETCKTEAIRSYYPYAKFIMLKYVVSDEEDIELVKKYTEAYGVGSYDEVLLMPCGGKADPSFDDMQRKVWDLCVKYGYRYSPRLQMIKLNSWGV